MNPETAQFLLSPEGRKAAASAAEYADDTLLAGTMLRKQYSSIDTAKLSAVVELVQLRKRGRQKFLSTDCMFFERDALEQASGAAVANHRAGRFDGIRYVCDGNAGIGGDSIAIGKTVEKLTCVEIDPVRCIFLRENLAMNGIDASVIEGDIREMTDSIGSFDALMLDPARRHGSRRTRKLSEIEPSIKEIETLTAHVENACVKMPTWISAEDIEVPCELEWVSTESGLKEAVMWTGGFVRSNTTVSLIHKDAVLTDRDLPDDKPEITKAGSYLFEPDPALIRSGLLGRKAASLGMTRIDDDIAYMSSDTPVDDPFFRAYRITKSMKFGLKRLSEALRDMDAGIVTVKKRGFPMLPEEVIAKLRLNGEKHATIVLSREKGRRIVYFVEPL